MDKLHVRVDFQLYEHDNKRVLVFEIAGHPLGLPVQVDGIAWWRDGDSLVPMPQEVLRGIYAESGHDFSGDICKRKRKLCKYVMFLFDEPLMYA